MLENEYKWNASNRDMVRCILKKTQDGDAEEPTRSLHALADSHGGLW